MDQEPAFDALLNHHSSQGYHPEHHYRNVVNRDGKYLGAYIPYVGKYYFEMKPPLLIYAMSQNLARARRLISTWLNSPDRGLLRQYHDSATPYVHVYPYDNGHLKVIAALTLQLYPETHFREDQNIDNLVAVTNFVKFSFFRAGRSGNRLDVNPPPAIYDEMWEYYCRYEVNVLRPNIIIGVGNKVSNAIARNLQKEDVCNIILCRVPFPGRLNLNSRWVPKGRELIEIINYDPATDMSEMQALVKGTPDVKGRVARAIKTDWYYFKQMRTYIREQIYKDA